MTDGIAKDGEGRGYRVVMVDGHWLDADFWAVAPDRACRNPAPAAHVAHLIQDVAGEA